MASTSTSTPSSLLPTQHTSSAAPALLTTKELMNTIGMQSFHNRQHRQLRGQQQGSTTFPRHVKSEASALPNGNAEEEGEEEEEEDEDEEGDEDDEGEESTGSAADSSGSHQPSASPPPPPASSMVRQQQQANTHTSLASALLAMGAAAAAAASNGGNNDFGAGAGGCIPPFGIPAMGIATGGVGGKRDEYLGAAEGAVLGSISHSSAEHSLEERESMMMMGNVGGEGVGGNIPLAVAKALQNGEATGLSTTCKRTPAHNKEKKKFTMEVSDRLVVEVIKRKDLLVENNTSRDLSFSEKKREAWVEVQRLLRDHHPLFNQDIEAIKSHWRYRKRKVTDVWAEAHGNHGEMLEKLCPGAGGAGGVMAAATSSTDYQIYLMLEESKLLEPYPPPSYHHHQRGRYAVGSGAAFEGGGKAGRIAIGSSANHNGEQSSTTSPSDGDEGEETPAASTTPLSGGNHTPGVIGHPTANNSLLFGSSATAAAAAAQQQSAFTPTNLLESLSKYYMSNFQQQYQQQQQRKTQQQQEIMPLFVPPRTAPLHLSQALAFGAPGGGGAINAGCWDKLFNALSEQQKELSHGAQLENESAFKPQVLAAALNSTNANALRGGGDGFAPLNMTPRGSDTQMMMASSPSYGGGGGQPHRMPPSSAPPPPSNSGGSSSSRPGGGSRKRGRRHEWDWLTKSKNSSSGSTGSCFATAAPQSSSKTGSATTAFVEGKKGLRGGHGGTTTLLQENSARHARPCGRNDRSSRGNGGIEEYQRAAFEAQRVAYEQLSEFLTDTKRLMPKLLTAVENINRHFEGQQQNPLGVSGVIPAQKEGDTGCAVAGGESGGGGGGMRIQRSPHIPANEEVGIMGSMLGVLHETHGPNGTNNEREDLKKEEEAEISQKKSSPPPFLLLPPPPPPEGVTPMEVEVEVEEEEEEEEDTAEVDNTTTQLREEKVGKEGKDENHEKLGAGQ